MRWRLRVLGTLILLLVVALAAYRLMAEGLPTEIVLNASENGGQIEIQKGQTLVVTLQSSPGTGYGWQVVELDEDILRQTGDPEFVSDSDLVGASGIQVTRFEAMGTGEVALKLVYYRSWEKDTEPLRIFACRVIVR
ncbi:MAG: hypothetical protein A2Y73_09310 [Chloroflexi bacterium RBG_13_56_8]|nr:MAG: hypothetical protein A2Y73_09310 [Chloroflexi bacterium RBG_13_56_8]